MRTLGYFIAAAAALAITVPAHAAGALYNGAGSTRGSGDIAGAKPFASNVTLAYAYTRGFGITRSVGVLAFTNPSTGVYCIQPSKPLKLTKIYPLVSIEWGRSIGEALQVFWRDTPDGTDCPPGDLEVQTWDISTGVVQDGVVIIQPQLTPNVAFDIVVD